MPYVIRRTDVKGGKSRPQLEVSYFDGQQWQPWGSDLLIFNTYEGLADLAELHRFQLTEINPPLSQEWEPGQCHISAMWVSPLIAEKAQQLKQKCPLQ